MDARPVDLVRARREAKALLRAARDGDLSALARVGTAMPQLSDAQLAVARELGERSWPALVRRAEAEAVLREERCRELVRAATTGRRADAEALLDPVLAREALDVALVLGDAERVEAALAHDPGVATRALGARGWEPLLYVTYSAFLGGERTDGLLACARALLDAGADPNAAWQDAEYERMPALHGAAGIAAEPRMTAVLLEFGADPDDGRSLRFVGGSSDLGERLVAAGASPERTGVVMGARLDRLALDAAPPPGVTVAAVRDAATLAAWRDVAQECLFDDADARARLLESLGEDAEVQHWIAVCDGRPVGAASFLVHREIAYGQHLGVLAPERRGGVGRALAEHALRAARDAGARIAVLAPTPDTIAFYRLLGFVLRPYLRDRSFYLPLPEE